MGEAGGGDRTVTRKKLTGNSSNKGAREGNHSSWPPPYNSVNCLTHVCDIGFHIAFAIDSFRLDSGRVISAQDNDDKDDVCRQCATTGAAMARRFR